MQKPNEPRVASGQHGLVISYFGSSVAVEAEDGQVFQCHLRRNQELPVVGDEVLWQFDTGNTGVISAILPRRSLLARGDNRGNMKPIAANIDTILIVMAPPPIFSEYLVDRYLIAAELLKIPPLLVLNKIDLLDNAARDAVAERLLSYRRIPYPIVLTSVVTQEGLQDLSTHLQGQTAVLVGPSGVGKSSIIAALGSTDDAIKIGEVTGKGAGKHTTTATRLYHLPHGGSLIDSPGVREFNLWPVSKSEILLGFKEFQPFSAHCRFRDCQHLAEPNCAVQAAIADGKISQQRYTSYQELMKEAKTSHKY